MGKINASSMGVWVLLISPKKKTKEEMFFFCLFLPKEEKMTQNYFWISFPLWDITTGKSAAGGVVSPLTSHVSGIFTFLADCLVLKEKKGTRFFCVRNEGQNRRIDKSPVFFLLGGCFVDPLTYFLSSSFLVLSLISSVKLSRSVQRTDIGRFIGRGIRIY